MKAMILAAGRGTRLRPLTNYQPKALVKVAEVPLLEIAIRRLISFGFKDIIINVHHFGDQIIHFLQKKDHFGINIVISDEQDELLDTGGGLKKAAHFFDDGKPFLLCNTDVLCDLDLGAFYQKHCESNALATLAVQKRDTSRYLLFDHEMVLNGWANVKTGEIKLPKTTSDRLLMLAFSGLHVIDPRFFDFMPEEKSFSIIDTYLKASQSEIIRAYRCDEKKWMDVGKVASLENAEPFAQILLESI